MFSSCLLFLLSSNLVQVYSAYAPQLDSATLLSNGQEAQRLNAMFQTMNTSDSCADGDHACIGGAIAFCQSGTWDTTRGLCAQSQGCFAVPNTRKAGTVLTCTTKESAITEIETTGATSSFSGDANTTLLLASNSLKAYLSANTTLNPSMDGPFPPAPTIQTVTATVTVSARVTTFPPETRTLSPQEAFSVLASLMAGGATIINAPPDPTSGTPDVTATLGSLSAEATYSEATPTPGLPSEPDNWNSPVVVTPSVSGGCY